VTINLTLLRKIRFDSQTGKLARNIVASDTLAEMLPQAEVAELLAAYAAATETLEAARRLRPEMPDVATMLDAQFRDGTAADPAELVEELSAAQIKHTQATRIIEALAAIPGRYVYELQQLIDNSVDGFTDRLDAQLQDLLDEAEAVLQTMPGVADADSAIRAGKHTEWARWLDHHESYQALRRDHLHVLRAAAPAGNFAPGRPAIGYAFFSALDDAIPHLIAAIESPGTTARLPFDVLDPSDPGHWRAVVAHRAVLEPVVEHADEAMSQAGAAAERYRMETEPGNPAPSARPAPDWSTPSFAGIQFAPKPDPRVRR